MLSSTLKAFIITGLQWLWKDGYITATVLQCIFAVVLLVGFLYCCVKLTGWVKTAIDHVKRRCENGVE